MRIHSFILETYIAPLQETTQRYSQPSHRQKNLKGWVTRRDHSSKLLPLNVITSLKSLCSMYSVFLKDTEWNPLLSFTGKFGTWIDVGASPGKFVIVTFRGLRTAIALTNSKHVLNMKW